MGISFFNIFSSIVTLKKIKIKIKMFNLIKNKKFNLILLTDLFLIDDLCDLKGFILLIVFIDFIY